MMSGGPYKAVLRPGPEFESGRLLPLAEVKPRASLDTFSLSERVSSGPARQGRQCREHGEPMEKLDPAESEVVGLEY